MLILNHNYFQVSPNNRNAKDPPPPFKIRRYVFGLFILLLVDIMWVASSEITKFIYTEKKLEKPFLITYIRTSLLALYLLALCFVPPGKDPCSRSSQEYTQLVEPANDTTEDENYYTEANNTLGDSMFVPVRAGETTDSDDAAPRAVRFNKVAEVRVMSAAQAGEALLARLSWGASMRAQHHAHRRAAAMHARRHVALAAALTLPWFLCQYLYARALTATGASEATALAGSYSAVSLVAALAPPRAQPPAHRALALLVLLVGVVGVSAAVWTRTGWATCASALGAGLMYAAHVALLRHEYARRDPPHAPLLLGLVGVGCVVAAWAGGAALSALGAERAEWPAPGAWPYLLLDAALGPLLTEPLWLWGRSLTSSLTASAALCLAAPLALGWEWARGGAGAGAGGAWGATGVLLASLGAALLLDAPSLPCLPCRLPCADLAYIGALCSRTSLASVRVSQELDEQSEALMTSDEPT